MYLLDTAMLDNICEIREGAAKGIIRLLSHPRIYGKEGMKKEMVRSKQQEGKT